MLSKLLSLFDKKPSWSCRYWKLYDPEKITQSFQSQEEARTFSTTKRGQGYLTIVYALEEPAEEGLLVSVLRIVSDLISGHKSQITKLLSELTKHLASGRRG